MFLWVFLHVTKVTTKHKGQSKSKYKLVVYSSLLKTKQSLKLKRVSVLCFIPGQKEILSYWTTIFLILPFPVDVFPNNCKITYVHFGLNIV